jgi:uncharacterized membrane protein YtjA (UPF0391 family)
MSPLVAGLFGFGGPELAALLTTLLTVVALPVLIVVLIVRVTRKPAAPSRYCPKCGRGLIQPLDAQFCCYCSNRLP